MTLLYVYDALCGWCYGFSPVIRALYDKHTASDSAMPITFTVLSGGMMTGNRVRPVAESMGYIEQAYKIVEDRTGVRFGNNYLNNLLRPGTYISDSQPPGQAMTLFKQHLPNRAIEFAGTLQTALYFDGIDLNVAQNYGPLVEQYGLNPADFVAHLNSKAIVEATLHEFEQVATWGIGGFPTVILDTGTQLLLVARGYCSLEELEATITQALIIK
jgi:putative protein-disulfide isomerase